MTPKVSICIPAYRQTHYLKKTLDSVLCQDYDDYEVVITDDSPDASVEALLAEYSFGPRLTYLRNATRRGSPGNWNRAVALSKGEYIKLLHHDDWFSNPTSLAQYVAMLDANPGTGFAFSGATARSARSGRTWHHYASERQIARLRREPTCLFYRNFVGPPSSTIIRRTSFLEYADNLVWLVDIAQYIGILRRTDFVATQKPLIVSTTQAAHQITSASHADPRLNTYEYFRLFNEIESSIPAGLRHLYVGHLLKLAYRFGSLSLEHIRRSGYDGEIPVEVVSALNGSSLHRAWELIKLRLSSPLRGFE